MTPECADLLDRLDDILDRERALVLAGNLDGLQRISAEKEQIVASLPMDAEGRDLAALRLKAQRNAELLAAAADGVRAVQKRLAARRAGPLPLSTYGPDGRREKVGENIGTVERRA